MKTKDQVDQENEKHKTEESNHRTQKTYLSEQSKKWYQRKDTQPLLLELTRLENTPNTKFREKILDERVF